MRKERESAQGKWFELAAAIVKLGQLTNFLPRNLKRCARVRYQRQYFLPFPRIHLRERIGLTVARSWPPSAAHPIRSGATRTAQVFFPARKTAEDSTTRSRRIAILAAVEEFEAYGITFQDNDAWSTPMN
jgi:hypothetical protein